MSSSKARAAMRAYLELDSEGRVLFAQLQEELAEAVRCADFLPSAHPEKASKRWAAVRRFMESHDL
jgi:hypothetical protein